MANAVVDTNEVFLNGVYYPTTRPVRSTLASIYPGKVVIGDTTKDSQLRASGSVAGPPDAERNAKDIVWAIM